jgi:succinoglycan biosynthesis transport protein ExoP
MADDHESPQPSIDVLEIMRRRGALLLWVAAVVMLIGVAYAYRSTPLYTSRGVLLAELPSVSQAAVRMVQASPASRVSIISGRVMSSANLQEIISKNGLYPELTDTPAEARGRFIEHLKFSSEDPQILESLLGTTRPEGAMAFSVSFTDEAPRVARDVANDLVALFLQENREVRREQAAETIRFLTGEAVRLEEEIAEREQRLSEFKTENAGALPDLADSNLQMLDRTGRDLDAVEQEIRTLRERQQLLTSELSMLSPSATVLNEQNAPVLSPYDRLKMLQREYLRLSSAFHPQHPDVQKARREIEALAQQTGMPAFDRVMLESELQAREDELTAARDRYTAEHPEVVRLEKAVETARQALATAPRTPTTRRMPTTPDNPAYITREVQLRGTAAELQAALERREELRSRYAELEKRLQVTPDIDRQYSALSRGLEQLVAQYGDIQGQINAAQLTLNLEEDPDSERFTVLQQPTVASSPSSPNRFVVATAERSDQAVRNVQDVVAYLEIPPLVGIPYIENRVDLKRRARRRLLAAGAVSLWIGAVFLMVVTPL